MIATRNVFRGITIISSLLVVAAIPSVGFAQQLGIASNSVTVSNQGGSFTATALSVNGEGNVASVSGIPTSGPLDFPTFSFDMVNNAVPAGVYTFTAGFAIDHAASSRRLEISVPGITLNINGDTLTGSVSNPSITLIGRSGDGSVTVKKTGVNVVGTMSITDSTFKFDADDMLQEIKDEGGILGDVINTIDVANQTYNYTFVLKQTGGSAVQFGISPGASFDAFPTSTADFILNSNDLQATFTGGYKLNGALTFGTATSGGGDTGGDTGGGGTTTTPDEEVQDVADTVNNIDVPTTGTVDDSTVNQVNDALTNTTTLGDSIESGLTAGTTSVSTTLDYLNTTSTAIDKAGTTNTTNTTSGGTTVSTTTVTTSVDKITSVIKTLSSTTTLSEDQKTTLTNTTTNTLTSLSKVVVAPTTNTTSTTSLLTSASNLLIESVAATGTLTQAMSDAGRTLAQTALRTTVSLLASQTSSDISGTDVSNVAQAQVLLQSNKRLLSKVLDTVSIPLGETAAQTQAKQATLQSNLLATGLSGNSASTLSQNLASRKNPSTVTVPTTAGSTTVSQILTTGLSASVGGNVEISSDDNNVTSLVTGGTTYPVSVKKIALVPEEIPEGITTLPNGDVLSVSNGVATTLSPSAKDPVAISSALNGIDSNLVVDQDSDGKLTFTGADNVKFAGTFAFDTTPTTVSGPDTVGSTVFVAPTGSPSDPGYSFKVNYDDGTSQNISPVISEPNFYGSLGGFGLDVSTDRSTGVITAGSTSLKPDYFIRSLSEADQQFLDANGDSNGIAYRQVDANNDGITDYEVISSRGVQLVYGVP